MKQMVHAHGEMMSSSSPSLTRISTTSTSYPLRDEFVDDHEPGRKPLPLGGEVEATSKRR